MSARIDLNQRLHLRDELRMRQSLFVETVRSVLDIARDPDRQPGALTAARYQLGRMGRMRRAVIEQVLSLPATTVEAQKIAAEARAFRDRLQAGHLANLGYWPAARMQAAPLQLAAELEARLADLVEASDGEIDAAERYLDQLTPDSLVPVWSEIPARSHADP